ncbi:hypothetical protein [Siansivirga zeaxanthinifaciens]|uniref:Uncharacterized protein n=1 Tax=Siansivirga zeaxanthinifaciens CC-SAMT-1 TaxID=1454006 RepID=A0A0C5WF07_9FLAO|nr:hypothetical protein [Siansivirga zeaxanthinifaciens]AJR03789.1 hypothetical protein AW14_09335 [Siansivirga zeaxanthinifaciens CC-SAMT-1]
MAKVNSLIKIEGTLDGLTFYKGKDGYLVRTKGGVSKNRINNDPAYARTRENGAEFGHVAKSGKQLRQALIPLLAEVKDGKLVPRLTKVLSVVKNADVTSARGERQVGIGMTTSDGQMEMKNFDFNTNAQLDSILLTEYLLDTATGGISIDNLNPMQQINAPVGASHVGFKAAVLNLDFTTNEKALVMSAESTTPLNNTPVNVNMLPASMPTGTGQTYFFLKMAFYQQINGNMYALNNGTYNALKIVEIT